MHVPLQDNYWKTVYRSSFIGTHVRAFGRFKFYKLPGDISDVFIYVYFMYQLGGPRQCSNGTGLPIAAVIHREDISAAQTIKPRLSDSSGPAHNLGDHNIMVIAPQEGAVVSMESSAAVEHSPIQTPLQGRQICEEPIPNRLGCHL